MSVYSLFNRRRDTAQADGGIKPPSKMSISPTGEKKDGGGGTPPTPPDSPVGQFITAESLTTFTGATGAISLIWGFVANNVPAVHSDPMLKNWVGFIIAAIVGALIYWINTTDPSAPVTPSQKRIGIVIAALNTLVLYSASFGTQHMLFGS